MMKTLLLILVYSLTTIHVNANISNSYRIWIDNHDRKLNGRLLMVDSVNSRIKIHSKSPKNLTFWYDINKLSENDKEFIRNASTHTESSNIASSLNLYNEDYYENTNAPKWKFFNIQECDVKLNVNYEKLKTIPKKFNYNKTGELENCILYLWDNPSFDRNIHTYLHTLDFKPQNRELDARKKNYTDGILTNIQVLHYLGVSVDDFKKLRWFFSAEDFAFFPEKVYKFLGVLDRVSKKFDENELFYKRHSKGIPIILYWKENGILRSRWSNFYDKLSNRPKVNNPNYEKIIYLKTKK